MQLEVPVILFASGDVTLCESPRYHFDSDVERRPSRPVPVVEVGARGDEVAHHVLVVLAGGGVQPDPTMLIGPVDRHACTTSPS
jgi:hypothetical protein